MKIYKQYVGEKTVREITENEFLEHTEGNGFFEKGTALKALEVNGYLRTAWAYYYTSMPTAEGR